MGVIGICRDKLLKTKGIYFLLFLWQFLLLLKLFACRICNRGLRFFLTLGRRTLQKKHISVECGVDKLKRQLGSEKDFILFLEIQGEKLGASVPDSSEETAIRRLLCWMGWEQTNINTGLDTKTNLYTFLSGMRDIRLSVYLFQMIQKQHTWLHLIQNF